MTNPALLTVSVDGPCSVELTVYKLNDSYYYGVYGSEVSTTLFYSSSRWGITVYDYRDGCSGVYTYLQDTPDPNPIGGYTEDGGSRTATVTI